MNRQDLILTPAGVRAVPGIDRCLECRFQRSHAWVREVEGVHLYGCVRKDCDRHVVTSESERMQQELDALRGQHFEPRD